MNNGVDNRPAPPNWIDANFVRKALKNAETDDTTKIDVVNVGYANKEGSGYLGLMFRVTFKMKTEDSASESKTLLVKCEHDAGTWKDTADLLNAFPIEIRVLSDVIPRLHQVLRPVEIDMFRPLAANCYDFGSHPREYIVLEDLLASGFRMADAGKPLDLEHCLLVLKNYGRLHAASAFLLKAEPRFKDLFSKDMFCDVPVVESGLQMERQFCTAAGTIFQKCPGYEKYAEKFFRLPGKLHLLVRAAVQKKRNGSKLLVLNHGDCWKNNLMFKYSKHVPIEMRFLDFQLSNVNNPARDLMYFLYANASLEVHQYHLDRVLNEYHSTLDATLRALGMGDAADGYPLEQLKEDMDDLVILGMNFSLMSSLVLTSEKIGPDFVKDFGNPNASGDTIMRTYDNPYSLPYLKYLTHIFEQKGLL